MATQEAKRKMKQLQELLQAPELRLKIQSASDERSAAKLVSEAGVKKGFQLDTQWIKEAFDDAKIARFPASLTESELLLLASTFLEGDTPPKLCHTDSCGGNHDDCCPGGLGGLGGLGGPGGSGG